MKKSLALIFATLIGLLTLGSNVSASSRMEWSERDASYSEDGLGYNRTASGAAWYYYAIPSNYSGPSEVQVPFNSRFNNKISVSADTCKGYGGFWILLRNEYNRNTGDLTGRPAIPTSISDVYSRDLGWEGTTNFVTYQLPTATIDDSNGTIRATKVGAWNDVKALFNKVRGTSAVPLNSRGVGYEWGTSSGLTYFCYSETNTVDSYTDSLHSYSTVNMGDEYESVPVQDKTTYLGRSFTVPKNSTVSLTFHHYIARKEADAFDGTVRWVASGAAGNQSGSINARDITGSEIDGLSAKEVVTLTADITAGSVTGRAATYCSELRIDGTANYRLSSNGSGGYRYDITGGSVVSKACITLVPAEDNIVKNGIVYLNKVNDNGTTRVSQTFNCQSGGGVSFVASKAAGNTAATVALVKNDSEYVQTTASGHDATVKVYAKPGDTVQYLYALCFGAHGVQAKSSGYFTRTDSANNSIKNLFTVYNGTKNSKEGNTSFLFGRADELLGDEIMVSNNHARTSSGLRRTSFKVANTGDYALALSTVPDYIYIKGKELRFGSPDTGLKGADNWKYGAYDCFFYSGITTFGNSQASAGYQIPGFQNGDAKPSGRCSSAGLQKGTYGGEAPMYSVVGATINQSLSYNYLSVWREYLSKYTGSCACNDDSRRYEQRMFTSYARDGVVKGTDSDAYYEYPVSTADNLFRQFVSYYNSGATITGRYKVPNITYWYANTSKLYRDGNYSTRLCTKKSKKCRFCYGTGKNRWCTGYIYDNWSRVGISGLKKAEVVFTNEPVTKTASVIIPYNFDTKLTASIQDEKEVLYAGETVTSDFNVDITPVVNPLTSDKWFDDNEKIIKYAPYATITPTGTQVQVAEFLVRDTNSATGQEITAEEITSGLGDNYGFNGSNICDYIYRFSERTFGNMLNGIADCKDEIVEGADLPNCDNSENGTMKYCEGNYLGNNQSNPSGEEGYYTAGKKTYGTSQYTKLVPDVKAGYKYCTIVGINYGNSHGINTNDLNNQDENGRMKLTTANAANSRSVNSTLDTHVDDGYYWHISAASCRTIAKKPSFQVWNGGLFSTGDVTTSVTSKYANATLGGLVQYDAALQSTLQRKMYYFGSWEQYYVVSRGEVTGFASASAMGYNGTGMSSSGFGTTTRGFSVCDFSRLTISNNSCTARTFTDALGTKWGGNYTDDTTESSSAVTVSDDTRLQAFIGQIIARYTKSAQSRVSQPAGTNVSASDDLYENLTNSVENSSRYIYVSGDAVLNDTLVQTSGTRVIHVSGHLSINRNICLGTGTCSATGSDDDSYKSGYVQATNSLSLLGRNTDEEYVNLSEIPQVIIIADSIGIGSEVSQIDAWLITHNTEDLTYDGGFVNTCDIFEDGRTGSGECWKTLKINGPVVTRGLLLNRTGGAWAGLSGDIGNPAYDYLPRTTYYNNIRRYYNGGSETNTGNAFSRDLSCDGSITPAEVFDLHPIVYLWAYYQSQRFTQAITTYTSEYAPRY